MARPCHDGANACKGEIDEDESLDPRNLYQDLCTYRRRARLRRRRRVLRRLLRRRHRRHRVGRSGRRRGRDDGLVGRRRRQAERALAEGLDAEKMNYSLN